MLLKGYTGRTDVDRCDHCGKPISAGEYAVVIEGRGYNIHAHPLCSVFPAARVLGVEGIDPRAQETAIAALEVYVAAARAAQRTRAIHVVADA